MLARLLLGLWFGPPSVARRLLYLLLLPVSWLYGLLFALNRALYAYGLKPTFRASKPVWVVGNFIVGGAGKTPLVIALAQALGARGVRVGVISRGYGAKLQAARLVTATDHAAEVGDEPLLIAQKTGCPVAVGAHRGAAAALIQTQSVDLILSDDGLQHFALARDLEWSVSDPRGLGNGALLPAGPLRERPRAVHAQLNAQALSRRLGHAYCLSTPTRVLALGDIGIADAVAGVANPQAFFDALAAARVQLQTTVALPDHHLFSDASCFEALQGERILITEKDAVKCQGLHSGIKARLWVVPLTLTLDDELVDSALRALNIPWTKK